MKSGFSLVELSIVLVILGLLTGGILAGQSLIRASELRSVPVQAAQYHSAVYSFRDKYMALPGDMINATSFWGAAHATPATCDTTAGTGTQTCNGNGNGQIEAKPERFRFWEQLANSGLIEGSYTGVTGPTDSGSCTSIDHIPGTNIPSLRISLGGVGASYIGTAQPGGNDYMFGGTYNNTFEIGATISGCDPIGGLFLPEEAWNIDTKLDDGKPGLGALKTRVSCVGNGCTPDCNSATTSVGATTAANATYLLGGTTKGCSFYYSF